MAKEELSPPGTSVMKMDKLVNTAALVLLLGLLGAAFMVMNYTAESNLVTTKVATIQAKNRSKVLQQIDLLTAEVRMLQEKVGRLRSKTQKTERK